MTADADTRAARTRAYELVERLLKQDHIGAIGDAAIVLGLLAIAEAVAR